MPTQHAKLGPSAASRWMSCSGSVELIDNLVQRGIVAENESSVYADEGTAAHQVREDCLMFGMNPDDYLGDVIEVNGTEFIVDDDMVRFLQPGIDWIREHTEQVYVEVQVDLSPWLPGQFGTMDAGWLDGSTLYISDLKYGQGENVSPINNKQQMLYALGFWHFLGRPVIEKVVINIDQPRAGGMKFWECDFQTLMGFADEVKEAYRRIVEEPPHFFPTEKGCRWCKARETRADYTGCTAYNDWMTSYFQAVFDDLDENNIQTPMTPARRYEIVKHAKMIERWLADLHASSLEAALNGNPDPGSKAVIGQRGNRYLTDAEKAEAVLVEALGDEAYKPRQLITITEAEKLLKPGKKKPGNAEAWASLNSLIDQPPGKPVLVSDDDERPAITPIADQFDDLP